MRSCSTSLTVSDTGIAATAPTPERALVSTPSIVSRVTKGRAPSWISTRTASDGRARRPARTDCARVAPPAARIRRSPTSFASHSGGRASRPGGRTTTTCPTSGCDVKGRSARSSIGTPRMGRNCFGSPGPARTPAPAATITTPASGCEAAGEVTDTLHSDHVQSGHRHTGARGEEHAPEPLPRRFAKPPLDGAHGADFSAEAHLAQEEGFRGEGPVLHARDERRQHGEVGGRLEEP